MARSTELSRSLGQVARGDLCAGCGACAGLFPEQIYMETQGRGWLRPVQTAPVTDDQDRIIAAICPGLGQRVEAEGRADPVLWGPYVSARTGWATDPQVRHAGSSGGALSMLLIHLLEEKLVDAVVQTAASPVLAIGNATVISTMPDQVVSAAGSRYAASAPLEDLSRLLADGRRFAFVGKPCDAAALRALIAVDPRYGHAFPVILSFFCAGVPSHTGGTEVLRALGTTLDQVERFRFRGNGWPGRATALLRDGSERSMSYHDSWGRILSRHLQHRCKVCADGTGIAADLVCADAWESDEAGYPVFDEAEGTSLIMARTHWGAKILTEAEARARLRTEPFNLDDLVSIQPGQRERRRALLVRLAALRLLGRPIPQYSGLQIWRAGRQNSLRKNFRNFAGMLRRTIFRQPSSSPAKK